MRASTSSGDSIRRNAALSLTNQLSSAVFTALLTFYLTHQLGPTGYGLFALALSVGSLAGLLADFGVSNSTARFVAEHRGDDEAQFAVIARGVRLKLIFVSIVAASLMALAGPISQAYGEPALAWPLRGAAIALAGQTLMLFITNVFGALRRIAANLRVILSESAVEATASIALVALGTGATGAAFGRGIGYAWGGVVTLVVLSRVLGRNVLRRPHGPPGDTRRIAGYAVPLFITSSVWTLFAQVDVLLLGALVGSGSSGVFQAAMRVNSMFTYGGAALAAGVSPRVAAGRDRTVGAFQTAVRYLILGHALLMAPIVVWASPIVHLLLGPAFGESVPVLRALAPYVFLTGLGPLLSSSVNYMGGAGRRVPIAIAALAVNGGLDLLLIPPLGPLGAAIGTDVGYLVYLPAHFWICRQTLGLELRPVALTLARAALAALAMALVLAVAGTGDLSVAAWILGGGGGVLAYVGTLVVTGELKREEVKAVVTWLTRRLTRLKRTTRR